jgi:hypothetical protein
MYLMMVIMGGEVWWICKVHENNMLAKIDCNRQCIILALPLIHGKHIKILIRDSLASIVELSHTFSNPIAIG